jgi:hypothetical protein
MLALVNTPNGKAPVELRQIRRRRVVGDGVARSGREWRGGGVRQFLRRDDKHQLCRFPRRAKCALAELLLVHFGAGGAVCAGSCIAGVAGRRQVADAADRAGAELARHCAGCRRAARPACRREGGVSGGAVSETKRSRRVSHHAKAQRFWPKFCHCRTMHSTMRNCLSDALRRRIIGDVTRASLRRAFPPQPRARLPASCGCTRSSTTVSA